MFVLRTLAANGRFPARASGLAALSAGWVRLAAQPEQKQQGALRIGHCRLTTEELANPGTMNAQLAGKQSAGSAVLEMRTDHTDDRIPKRGFRARPQRSAAPRPRPPFVNPPACLPNHLASDHLHSLKHRNQRLETRMIQLLHPMFVIRTLDSWQFPRYFWAHLRAK